MGDEVRDQSPLLSVGGTNALNHHYVAMCESPANSFRSIVSVFGQASGFAAAVRHVKTLERSPALPSQFISHDRRDATRVNAVDALILMIRRLKSCRSKERCMPLLIV